MRFKKQKRHRKTVRFFSTCFGFRHPFKVLCDGTFIHHLIANRILPADQAVSNLLSGPVKLFTTRCVQAELKRLGQTYSQSLDAARDLMVAICGHEKVKAADACCMEVIGQTNPDHFFVASQDSDLRKKFQEIPGVPSIYGLRNALYLEPLSESQRQHIKKSEDERSHMTELERNLLKKRAKRVVKSEDEDGSQDEKEDSGEQELRIGSVKKTRNERNAMAMKDKPQFKRKRANGPNPLSCKKKKNPENKNQAAPKNQKQSEDGNNNSEKRSRKRKRSRGHKQSVEAEN